MMKSCQLALLPVLALVVLGCMASQANAQVGNIPQFLPTSGWQVQKSVLSEVRGLQGLNLPCMMATTYDNGYSLRFSGSNQQILAMAIDFRQDVFVQGRKYPAQLKVGEQYNRGIRGTAFSKNVLIFNMREMGGFYNAISEAAKMTLDVQGNPMIFSLGGVGNALTRLQGCSTGADFDSGVQQASLPPSKAMTKPTWGQDVTPVPARISKSIKKSQAAQAPLWQAKAGDDMEITLSRWASRAGVQLDWQATGESKVASDVRVQGSFEDAVQALMAQNAAALGLDANMKASSGSMRRVSVPVSISADSAPQQLTPTGRMGVSRSHGAGGKWTAPMGVSLQHVLQKWSKQAGVELIWESNQGFSVKREVVLGGSYEAALQSLLNQYGNEKIRPNAQLNNDPVTGRRILFVRSSRVL